jgi:hypothetical protein
MSRGPHPRSALVVLVTVLLVSTWQAFGQSPNQDPNRPATQPGDVSTTHQSSPGKTTSNSPGRGRGPTTVGRPGGTTGNDGGRAGATGGGSSNTSGGRPRTGSGGGGHAGVIAGGVIGGAVAGIGIFELLHHAHAPNSGQGLQRIGLSLHYPEDWQLNPRLSLEQDPINFNNFNSSYLRGGIIPMGGADIDIAYFPGINGPVPELISSELADTNEKQIDEHTYRIDGNKGTRVFYTDVYARGFAYRNIAVYLPREAGLYKFFLTYHDGDPHEKAFNDDFEHILKSVRFER